MDLIKYPFEFLFFFRLLLIFFDHLAVKFTDQVADINIFFLDRRICRFFFLVADDQRFILDVAVISLITFLNLFDQFENIIAMMMDLTGWSRRKTCLVCCPAMLLLSLPCIFGFNLLKDITPLGAGSNLMDLEDFIVSNVLLPVGSLVFALFCTLKYGWGWNNFKAEANEGSGIKVKNWMRVYMTYILPVIIFALFIVGIWDKFFK